MDNGELRAKGKDGAPALSVTEHGSIPAYPSYKGWKYVKYVLRDDTRRTLRI